MHTGVFLGAQYDTSVFSLRSLEQFCLVFPLPMVVMNLHAYSDVSAGYSDDSVNTPALGLSINFQEFQFLDVLMAVSLSHI